MKVRQNVAKGWGRVVLFSSFPFSSIVGSAHVGDSGSFFVVRGETHEDKSYRLFMRGQFIAAGG